jgi:hypothetical protein
VLVSFLPNFAANLLHGLVAMLTTPLSHSQAERQIANVVHMQRVDLCG